MVQASPNHQIIHHWSTPVGKGSTYSGSSRYGQFSGFKRLDRPIQKRHNLVYKTILRESVIVNPETLMDWNSEELPKMIDGYHPKEIINVDKTGLFHNLQPSMTLTYKSNSCHGGTKSKQRVTLLLGCNADGTEKLPPLVIGKYNKPHCFRCFKNSAPNAQQIRIHE